MIETVLQESQANFRPLAEVAGQQKEAHRRVTELGGYAKIPEGSLRLRRAAKRRCVDQQERPGGGAETTEWVFHGRG